MGLWFERVGDDTSPYTASTVRYQKDPIKLFCFENSILISYLTNEIIR
jgi:hypothetical protein